ncbi:hypothetical protein HanPI659440_Chr00c10g0722181 [Helianthus annuus]|nr:hypothetical protein HanPI659440_Chr00c10g0722181 [Helianthus annuus]
MEKGHSSILTILQCFPKIRESFIVGGMKHRGHPIRGKRRSKYSELGTDSDSKSEGTKKYTYESTMSC